MAMAESGAQEQEQSSGNGSDARKTAFRAAAIAAASGATAIAARKAFSGSQSQQENASKQQNGGGGLGGDSLVGGMVGSGLNAARDSLLPFAEQAANAAGEYLGSNGPDFVRETIVPAFIEGFQGAQQSSGDDE
jgi:hypothetical protein